MENKYIVSLDGGKESTAMLLILMEKKYPINEIIFYDTGVNFPETYRHLNKLENKINIKITRLKAKNSFEHYLLNEIKTKGKGKGEKGWGFPTYHRKWCVKIIKKKVIKEYLKDKGNYIEYVGIASDGTIETVKKDNQRFPLMDWEMTSQDCLEYCLKKGYDWEGLYNKFDQIGCWCCPIRPVEELAIIYREYPDFWNKLKSWQTERYKSKDVYGGKFRRDYDIFELDSKFHLEKKYGGRFSKKRAKEYIKNKPETAMKERDNKAWHVVSFSGGKDSTAMLLKMLEEKMPVDEVIFCDTGMEFPEMYRHLQKVENYIGMKITRLKSKDSFEYLMLDKKKKSGKNKGETGYGFPNVFRRWCTIYLKQQVIAKHLEEKSNCIHYVGFAFDEQWRANKNTASGKHPLIDWKMTEADCLQYCYDRGFDWDGLYDKFHRLSCWCCPMNKIEELRTLYSDYPKLWNKLKEWQRRNFEINPNRKFRKTYSVFELDRKFELEAKLGKKCTKKMVREYFGVSDTEN